MPRICGGLRGVRRVAKRLLLEWLLSQKRFEIHKVERLHGDAGNRNLVRGFHGLGPPSPGVLRLASSVARPLFSRARRAYCVARGSTGAALAWYSISHPTACASPSSTSRRGADRGEPILLIHGFASNHRINWINPRWVETLSKAGRRVVAFDNRGHGAEREALRSRRLPLGDRWRATRRTFSITCKSSGPT